ncbi:Serine/threonine protein kinase, partial [Globisporangium splendens]
MASHIIPYLLELMVAAASGLEWIEANLSTARVTAAKSQPAFVFPKQKLQVLHQFARVLRFDIVYMIDRCDEAMIHKAAHHIFQFFAMCCDLPAEFIELIRDLLALLPEFRVIFLKNQCTNVLWKALHTGNRFQLSAIASFGKRADISPLAQAIVEANADAARPKSGHERRSSLFGSRKQSKKEAQSGRSTHFVSARCNKKSVRQSECTGVYNACKRKKRSRLSPKLCMYELVLQLILELMHSTSSRTWEKDAGLLLHLENVHESLFNEIVQQMKDAIAMCSKDEAILFPDIVLADQVNYCRLRVVAKWVSDLFRLELKRRNQVKTALGDKKCWYFIHLFRSQLRDFNDYLERCSENENDTNEDDIDEGDEDNHDEETDRTTPLPERKVELLVHIEIFRWIPRALLDEWIVLSLEDFLQTASVLSGLIERHQDANPHHIEFACQLLQIFRFILLRSTDVDLQTLLVRVLNRGCSSIISLLRHLATVATKPADGDYLLFLLIPKDDVMLVERAQRLSFSLIEAPTLPVVHCFQQKLEPDPLTSCKPYNFKVVKSFQTLQQLLHVSLIADSLHARIDFHPCISSHMHCIERYYKRYTNNLTQENPQFLRDAVEWHLKNLIALGNRRTYFPAITDAFGSLKVIPTLLNLVEREHVPDDTQRPASRAASRPKLEPIVAVNGENEPCDDLKQYPDGVSGITEVTPIGHVDDLAPVLRLKLPVASIPRIDLDTAVENRIATSNAEISQNAKNHALLIILIASYLILDSNLDLDPAICPRFAIPGVLASSGSTNAEGRLDLLWSLQQHLALVKLNVKAFERMVHDLETALVFSTSARVAAVRSLMRLLVASLLDRDIYVRPWSDTVTTTRECTAQLDQTPQESGLAPGEPDSPIETCTYATKGAFSTVYRSVPLLPKTNVVAIKVLAHQKRAGDLSVLSDVYNEIAVLKRLQGEHAAIQMLDYGNRHEAQSFVIMMEFCPCTLNEWRASLESESLRVPFRSLMVMVLRAFSIQGDNVLLRTSACDLTRRLLVYEERESYESEAVCILKSSFCFGDFGESMILESEHLGQSQCRTTSFVLSSPTALPAIEAPPTLSKTKKQGFVLTRTRGTEAIKSPEMLQIKGSDAVKEGVTFSSDIWSMGCLLYELITQDLMFGKDDAAGLYTHLAISQAKVLREDHVQKIQEVLNPKNEPENLFVSRLIGLCEKILTRSPSRLSVTQLLAEVQRLLEDILQLPNSSEDKRYVEHAFADPVPQMDDTNMPASSKSTSTQSTVAKIPSLPNLRSRLYSDAGSYADQPAAGCQSEWDAPVKAVFCRLFWNLYVGGIHDPAVANVHQRPQTAAISR